MIHYRCHRCFHDFMEHPGPNICNNCGHEYVSNVEEWKKTQAAYAEKRAMAAREGDEMDADVIAPCDCG